MEDFTGPWQDQRSTSQKRPHDVSHYGSVLQTVDPTALYTGQPATVPYVNPYQSYQQPQSTFNNSAFYRPQFPYEGAAFQQQPHVPLTTAEYQSSLTGTYITAAPVVHEGFIPAPGHEEEDALDDLYPSYRDSLFNDQSDDSNDSDDERELLAEEERLLRDIESKNDDADYDSDFSMEDAEEYDEDDPDELIVEEEIDDEEDDDDDVQTRRPRSSTRGGRGRGRGRGRPPSRGRGGLRGSQSKRGRGRPKAARGPRPTADPGPEFKEYQRVANDAYLRKDYPKALENANKAIRLNPEIFATHSLRSEIFADMGNEQMSLEALLVGAPTKRDKELWFYIIDRVKKIDPKEYPVFTNSNKTALILDCLRAILLIDGDDYEARSQKLEIESRLGHISRSVKMCRRMLSLRPYDIAVLKMMARLGTSSPKQTRLHLSSIINSFDTSIAYLLEHDDPANSNLDWSLLNIYLDLLDQNGDYARGITRAKTLSRWIQLRKDETYWEDQEDDREFDADDLPRRVAVPDFTGSSETSQYGKTLPLEIRTKLGLFRLRLQPPDIGEAMHHFEFLEPENKGPDPVVQDYPDLFRDVADALHKSGYNREALRFYECLYDSAFEHMTLRNFIGMYSSYVGTEQKDEAEELLPIFQKWNPDTIEDMAVLAKFFEDHGFEEDAMKRGEAAYRFGGGRLLQKIGFQGYADLQEYFYQEKKRARGRHAVKKARVKKYMRALRKATGENDGSEEELSDDRDEMLPLDPLTGRPRPGLFRTRKSFPRYRPETFLPDEIPGTKVPMEAVDHVLFQKKLNQLANDYPEELKAARAQHREIVASFQRLEQLSDSAEDGDREATLEWISIARELIEEFSTFDLFYYNRRKPFTGYFRRVGAHNEIWKDSALMVLAVAANNVEDGEDEPELRERPDKVPDSFYGVHFDKWLDMFTEYAILLARYGEDERCFNTIEVASQSNIFYQSRHYHHQLQLCRLSCGIVLDDSLQCSSAVRWLMRTYPFGSDLFRLYGAVNRLCSIPTGFATGPSLKVFLRYIKTMDFALLRRDQRQWFNFRGSDHVNWMAKAVSTNSVEFVKDHDPAVFTTYAHVLMCGGSYTAALNYYFRAFAIIPEDPLLNLSIGVAYIQHAMKRLSENRQYQTQQGLSFIYRYYELRTKQNVKAYRSEAEFNLGRIWHALGLVSQAIPAYERCIKLSTGVHVIGKEGEDGDGPELDEFATEAAFALQSIYALSGDFQAARKITEGSLVIE